MRTPDPETPWSPASRGRWQAEGAQAAPRGATRAQSLSGRRGSRDASRSWKYEEDEDQGELEGGASGFSKKFKFHIYVDQRKICAYIIQYVIIAVKESGVATS